MSGSFRRKIKFLFGYSRLENTVTVLILYNFQCLTHLKLKLLKFLRYFAEKHNRKKFARDTQSLCLEQSLSLYPFHNYLRIYLHYIR